MGGGALARQAPLDLGEAFPQRWRDALDAPCHLERARERGAGSGGITATSKDLRLRGVGAREVDVAVRPESGLPGERPRDRLLGRRRVAERQLDVGELASYLYYSAVDVDGTCYRDWRYRRDRC